MSGLGDIIGYREPPHHSKFYLHDPSTDVLLTGSPDGIFIRGDGSLLIVDYKTAKYTGTQDQLYPMYEVQLNAYALIGESLDLKPVSGLALIYMEPITDSLSAAQDENHREYGFSMEFSAHIMGVKLDLTMLPPLLSRTREIFTLEKSPKGLSGCKDCHALQEIFWLVSRRAAFLTFSPQFPSRGVRGVLSCYHRGTCCFSTTAPLTLFRFVHTPLFFVADFIS